MSHFEKNLKEVARRRLSAGHRLIIWIVFAGAYMLAGSGYTMRERCRSSSRSSLWDLREAILERILQSLPTLSDKSMGIIPGTDRPSTTFHLGESTNRPSRHCVASTSSRLYLASIQLVGTTCPGICSEVSNWPTNRNHTHRDGPNSTMLSRS